MKISYLLVLILFLFSVLAQGVDITPLKNREIMDIQNKDDQKEIKVQETNQIKVQEDKIEESYQKEDQNKNMIKIQSTIKTNLNLLEKNEGNITKIAVKLSNGKEAEVKIMPETASEVAIQRLGLKFCSQENNCSIELKQVGQDEQTKVIYEVKAEKQAKILGIFATKVKLKSQVNVENGEVTIQKPWWLFLAKEI